MNDNNKTKDQLIRELVELRRRVSELEAFEEGRKQMKEDGNHLESREIDLEKLTHHTQAVLEERYRALFENNPIETIIVDHEAKVTGSNLAKRRESSKVPDIGDVMYKDYAGRHETNMHEALIKCMKSGVSKEFPKQRYDGRFLQIRISPFSGGAIITSIDITDQVRAEEAMRKSQKRVWILAHALESCSQPFAMIHVDGRIMTYNAAFRKMTGYNKEELHKVKRFAELVPKERHTVMKDTEEKIRRTKQPQGFETELIRKDGSRVSAEVSEHPAYDSNGNLQHCFFFFTDINNNRRLSEALAESEARFRAIIENNPIQTIIADSEGKVTFSNLTETKLEGSVPNAGDVMFRDFAGEGKIDMHRELMACMRSGISKEFPEQKYDDKLLHIKISPFSGGAVITLADVTKLKSMASALEESEKRFHVVADFAHYWEFWIGRNGKHFYVSPSCEQITGYRPDEFQKDPELLRAITHSDDRGLLEAHYGDDFQEPEPRDFSFRILKRGGEQRWISHLCRPVYGPDGRFMGRRASNRDCTDLKEMENNLQVQTAEFDEVRNELSQYGDLLSYDLRAPLRAIRNYTDFLRDDLGERADNSQKAYLEGLEQVVKEAEDLLEDLFEFSQIERGSETIEMVHVGDFLRQLIARLYVSADVNLVIQDDWPTLEVQVNFLRKIFQNLIDNALKFNNSSQKIVEIAWRSAEDERYEFCVRDNGIGIQSRYFDQIFGVFQRLHTLEEYEGNGMGLAIVKKVVSKLGGSVRLMSKPGEGSTFFVTLPRTQMQGRAQ